MKNGEHVGCSEPISSDNTEKTNSNKLMRFLPQQILVTDRSKTDETM